MKYTFYYFFKSRQEEITKEIEADTDSEAVLKLFDKVGICEFGCVKSNGKSFSDENFPKKNY